MDVQIPHCPSPTSKSTRQRTVALPTNHNAVTGLVRPVSQPTVATAKKLKRDKSERAVGQVCAVRAVARQTTAALWAATLGLQ